MTQEDKDLLLKDLSARLSYGVMLNIEDIADTYNDKFFSISFNHGDCLYINGLCVDNNGYDSYATIKPYLFPLSSMTEEQRYNNPIGFSQMLTILANRDWEYVTIKHKDLQKLIDWFNKNHFDYRGLIGKGLAIDATSKNIY